MSMSTLTTSGELRRAEILEAAAALFDELGFHRTTTAAIADRVGTAKATVYHYFRAKHDILHAIHEEWIDELLALFQASTEETSDPVEIVRRVMDDIVSLIAQRPGHVRVFFEYFRELPPELQTSARIKRDRYEELVEGAILQGMKEGSIAWQDPRTASFALFGMCNWAYQWYRADGRLSHDEVSAQLFRIFMTGVASRSFAERGADA
ncbi:TetR/AcrR family transcriptional regulator [Herbiconiux solani]|uniref:TetR/AcrR family transcriptional regulator n=1 Tax=Herbiconiux solani TaxID=661329 RepID=UPI0009FCEEFA|nr:TetR/AcrR family transcriptional regulator [Herbiconiux solani]